MTPNYQYVSDRKGKTTAIIIPIKDFQKMQDDLDELEAIKEYDQAKSEVLTFQPLEEALKDIEKERMKNYWY